MRKISQALPYTLAMILETSDAGWAPKATTSPECIPPFDPPWTSTAKTLFNEVEPFGRIQLRNVYGGTSLGQATLNIVGPATQPFWAPDELSRRTTGHASAEESEQVPGNLLFRVYIC